MTTSQSAAGRVTIHPESVGPLVVATAGPGAAAVIAAARFLSGRLGATPMVVAVHDPVFAYVPEVGMAPLLPELEAEQREILREDVVGALRAAGGDATSWTVAVTVGPPAPTIAHIARERGARMIVMGIGRRAPLDRFFGAETTLRVMRLADQPVFAVVSEFAGPPAHVAVAIDFSAPSVLAAEEALALLGGGGGTLSLVHVRQTDRRTRRAADDSVREMYQRRVTDLFRRLRAMLTVPSSITVRDVVLEGDPAPELVGFAEREGVDLIATGSSGMGFMDRLIVGSVATQILRRSEVSVLAVPRPSPAEVQRIERELVTRG